ncbi:MAG: DUF1566 domain-containing protein [Prevotellaceae bacterium]|jgi:hypothetical protein|nr:DUF1566 domain-containing protein [Prevotellaceae bacterium]
MKKIIFIICCLCTIGVSAQQEKKKIVISATPDTTISKDIVGLFIDELGVGLNKSGKYEVVQNRKEFAAVLGEEVEFQESGYVNDEEQIELGKAAGAEIACYTTIRKIGRNFNITCKFLDLKTGKSIGQPFSLATKNGEDDLIDVAHLMARNLASGRDITAERKADWVKAPKCYYDEYTDKYIDCDISISDEESLPYAEACDFCKNKGDGWRLPTQQELMKIYNNRFVIEENGSAKFKYKDYWSSSKRNNYESYVVNFSTGKIDCYSKNIKNPFRCIRYD